MRRDDVGDLWFLLIVAVYLALLCSLVSCARPLVTSSHDNTLKATAQVHEAAKATEATATVAKVDKRPKRVIHLRPDRTPWKIEEDAGESSSTVTSSSKSSSSSTDTKVDVAARERGQTAQRATWGWRRALAVTFGVAMLAGVVGVLLWRRFRPRIVR